MGLATSKRNADGSFGPSTMAKSDKKALSCKTALKFDETCKGMNTGTQKVLVVGTENGLLECINGKNFSTGHNPTETFMPLAHFAHAGFEFDFATPTGKKFPIEAWAWGSAEACGIAEPLRKIEADNKASLEAPITIAAGLKNLLAGKYIMVFAPGGHGALNVKKESAKEDVGKILSYCHEKQITTATICHGPDVLRCAPAQTYKGYQVAAFLDKNDDMAARFGYLPGKLKEEDYPQRNLIKEQGCIYTNKKNDDSVMEHKELITGSTNLASQRLGAAVVQKLKDVLNKTQTEQKANEKAAETKQAEIKAVSAACKCGAVKYEIRAPTAFASAFCHSKDCQTFFGTDFAKLSGITDDELKIVAGADTLDGEDRGDKGTRYTCKECKSYIYNKYPNGLLSILSDVMGTDAFQPSMHIHYSERKADATDDLPKFEGPPEFSVLTQ